MTEKFAAIQRMKEMMKERGLQHVFLNNTVYTTHPGFDKPGSDNRPYSIREVEYDKKDNDLIVWQHWDQTTYGDHIESFEEGKVLMIEAEFVATIKLLKKYTVKLSGCIDVMATSAEKAKETVKHMPGDDIRRDAYWLWGTDDVEEKK
jgi:hypothetical protein